MWDLTTRDVARERERIMRSSSDVPHKIESSVIHEMRVVLQGSMFPKMMQRDENILYKFGCPRDARFRCS